jgi:hypothetical protein
VDLDAEPAALQRPAETLQGFNVPPSEEHQLLAPALSVDAEGLS